MVTEGAHIIDVGGESTRPGADDVSPSREIMRIRPIIKALARDYGVPVSVDTRHAAGGRRSREGGCQHHQRRVRLP